MYEVIIEKQESAFIAHLNEKDKRIIKSKLLDLQNGNFHGDKALKGRYRGKFCKRAGNFRISYLKEDSRLLVCVIRISDRRDAYE